MKRIGAIEGCTHYSRCKGATLPDIGIMYKILAPCPQCGSRVRSGGLHVRTTEAERYGLTFEPVSPAMSVQIADTQWACEKCYRFKTS